MRYVSADRSIAAAGAAFACPYDDTPEIQKARHEALQLGSARARIKRFVRRALIFCGLVIA
ncbi:MAG: hypothetical protein ACRCWF_01845 [Beijerinckiaceae bacterium]